MDPIRPIGPPERDVEPVVRVARSPRDARQERPDPRDGAPRERPRRQPDPPPQPPPDDESGTSLIDVRV
jgi:hypothetical protein